MTGSVPEPPSAPSPPPTVSSPTEPRPAAGPTSCAAPESAVPFATRNQHGQSVGLDDLVGAPAVLVFFPYAFTGICTGELRQLRDHAAEFAAHRARVLAISCDPMYALRTFADAEGFSFDLLTDHWPHGAIARSYGVFDEATGCARRASFILDAQGRVRWQVVNEIGAPRAVVDVLTALAETSRNAADPSAISHDEQSSQLLGAGE